MKHLEVFDCSNIFIGCYFTDDHECIHCNREHTLIYVYSGELEIIENGKKSVLHSGDCAFMRRDNRMILHKYIIDGKPYRSVFLKFSREFLKEFYQTLNKRDIPTGAKRNKDSLVRFPGNRVDIRSLFESVRPYFDDEVKPSEEILKLKMIEGVYSILNTDENLYASLFDFVDNWKIDIVDFLEHNYMNDLSMEEIAYYTGRSLATFKRDFKKISDLSPQKWLIRRRLEAAHKMITSGHKRVTEACFDAGFKNLSHFSKVYKAFYGVPPTASSAIS